MERNGLMGCREIELNETDAEHYRRYVRGVFSVTLRVFDQLTSWHTSM